MGESLSSSLSFTSKRAVSPNPYLDNPVNGYACPSGMALHYDDVPINGMVGEPAACFQLEESTFFFLFFVAKLKQLLNVTFLTLYPVDLCFRLVLVFLRTNWCIKIISGVL